MQDNHVDTEFKATRIYLCDEDIVLIDGSAIDIFISTADDFWAAHPGGVAGEIEDRYE